MFRKLRHRLGRGLEACRFALAELFAMMGGVCDPSGQRPKRRRTSRTTLILHSGDSAALCPQAEPDYQPGGGAHRQARRAAPTRAVAAATARVFAPSCSDGTRRALSRSTRGDIAMGRELFVHFQHKRDDPRHWIEPAPDNDVSLSVVQAETTPAPKTPTPRTSRWLLLVVAPCLIATVLWVGLLAWTAVRVLRWLVN